MANRDSTSDLQVDVYDKGFAHKREIGGLRAADLTLRLNAVSDGTIELDADDPVNAYLQAPGARVVCKYRGRQELSGPVRKQGLGLLPTDRAVYTVEDDYRMLANTLAWVVPFARYSSQGRLDAQALSDDAQAISTVAHDAGTNAGYGAFVFDTGAGGTLTSEAAIKQLLTANLVTRLGSAWQAARGTSYVPNVVAADQGRGGDAGVAGKLPVPRFENLADTLAALLTWSGLRITAGQTTGTNPTVLFDVEAPTTWPQTVTLDSGILIDGSGSISGMGASRIAVGGPGDVTARDWHEVKDTTREALWGDVIEVLKDAGSAPMTWPTTVSTALQVAKYYRLRSEVDSTAKAQYLAALDQAGADGLTEGAPRSGIGVQLAETDSFHFGGLDDPARGIRAVRLGTNIPTQLAAAAAGAAAPVIVAKVTQAQIKLDESTGVSVTTTVGERTDDPDEELARALAAVQTALRRRASRA